MKKIVICFMLFISGCYPTVDNAHLKFCASKCANNGGVYSVSLYSLNNNYGIVYCKNNTSFYFNTDDVIIDEK